MKRRKKTNSQLPAKGRLRDIADQLWSLAVKADWNHRCAICDIRGDLNSHHLIPRQHTATRYDLGNGICLCRRCHQFCPDRSPHQNAAGFILWLEEMYPGLFEWLMSTTESGAYQDFAGTKNAAFYVETICELRQYFEPEEFERIVGVRLSAYLEELV